MYISEKQNTASHLQMSYYHEYVGLYLLYLFILLISAGTALPTPNEWKISANNNYISLS